MFLKTLLFEIVIISLIQYRFCEAGNETGVKNDGVASRLFDNQ